MEITGNINECPLPELLQFLDHRQATGSLSLEIFSEHYPELKPQSYKICLHEGHIVSLQRECRRQDIYDLAVQQGWISLFASRKLRERAPNDIAAGLYLESQGVLDFGQLRSIFFSEVVHPIESLCSICNAIFFHFESISDLTINKTIGFGIPATKVAKFSLENTFKFVSKATPLQEIEVSISNGQTHPTIYNAQKFSRTIR